MNQTAQTDLETEAAAIATMTVHATGPGPGPAIEEAAKTTVPDHLIDDIETAVAEEEVVVDVTGHRETIVATMIETETGIDEILVDGPPPPIAPVHPQHQLYRHARAPINQLLLLHPPVVAALLHATTPETILP